MNSYLSYFSSSSSLSINQQQQRPSTPSSSSTWSSAFSSRVATLRKALTKDSEEDDPENEDCSHVSNVLRAYYTQKGRSFPEWLPPDPKKPPPVVVQQQPQYVNSYGGYGGTQYNQPVHGRGTSGGRGGLSDLWDPPAPAQPSAPIQSLRAPRPTPQSLRSNDSSGSTGSAQGVNSSSTQQNLSARPLPSQRAGSYQTTQNAASAGSLGSRDRLRARLQGGERSNSPLSSGNVQSTGSYSSQGSTGGSSPYVSASEPWSTGADEYGFGGAYTDAPRSGQYGSSGNGRQRPGGAR